MAFTRSVLLVVAFVIRFSFFSKVDFLNVDRSKAMAGMGICFCFDASRGKESVKDKLARLRAGREKVKEGRQKGSASKEQRATSPSDRLRNLRRRASRKESFRYRRVSPRRERAGNREIWPEARLRAGKDEWCQYGW